MKTRNIVLTAGALVSAAAAILLSTFRSSDTSLLRQATRIASTQNWALGGGWGFLEQTGYFWLSDHQVFHFMRVMRNGQGDDQAVQLDTHTGVETALPAVRLTEAGMLLSTSPDGKQILWTEHPRSRPTPAVTAVNDSSTVRWPGVWNFGDQAWMPDSRHWVTYISLPVGHLPQSQVQVSGIGIAIYGLTPPSFHTEPLPAGSVQSRILGVTQQGNLIIAPYGGDRFYLSRGNPNGNRNLLLSDINLKTRPLSERQFSVPKPQIPGAQDGTVVLSPKGDRLLWYYHTYHAQWLNRVPQPMPHSHWPPLESVDVWVSQLDGTQQHHLGRLDIGRHDYFTGAMHWTPDEKRISFVYDSTLMTVPVP